MPPTWMASWRRGARQMAMVDLKSVYRVTSKGKTYLYAWKGKGAPRLHAEEGTNAFIEELADALAPRTTGDRTRLSGLCAMYRASDEWKKLSPKTRENWSPWLDKIQEKFGPLRLAQFDRQSIIQDVKAWRNKFKATPRSADVAMQVFSRLLNFGKGEGKLSLNVVSEIPRLYTGNRSAIIWTDEDLAALEAVAPAEIMWAVKLAINTGLRQGDLLRLRWSDVKENAIAVRTAKTGAVAFIPIHATLRATLKDIPKRGDFVLTNRLKRAWGSGFGSSWGVAVKASKVDKHFHDLRGTAATKFYLAGWKVRQIASVMGWSEDQVDAILTRYVNSNAVALEMIRQMDENAARTKAEKPGEKPARKAAKEKIKKAI